MDDSLSSQKKLILTDAVTGLYSRYSYNEDLELYRKMDRLPDDLTVFSIDVNGLKTSNDTLVFLSSENCTSMPVELWTIDIEEIIQPWLTMAVLFFDLEPVQTDLFLFFFSGFSLLILFCGVANKLKQIDVGFKWSVLFTFHEYEF